MTPTTPTHHAQRIDQVWSAGVLVEELVYAYPLDGTAVRRRDGQPDEPVTGLPIPETPTPTAEARLAAVATAVAEAEAVETIADMEALRETLAAALGGQ
jgi:hypothetical protein